MIRVAIKGADEATCREISRRLRDALVFPRAPAATGQTPNEEFDAIAFVGTRTPDSGEIERHLVGGKHVLLSIDASPLRDHWESLIQIARTAGMQFSVVNPDHAVPSRQLIRQQIVSGKLGEVGLVRIHRWEPSMTESAFNRLSLPGSLINDLELTQWLFDKTPDVIYAISHATTVQDENSGDLVQVHLGFPGGGMALITYSNRLPPGDGYQSLSVIGSSGAAYADDHLDRQLVFGGGHPQAVRAGEGITLAAVIQDFSNAIHERRKLPGSLSAWIGVWDVADAVQRSIESGQAIYREAH